MDQPENEIILAEHGRAGLVRLNRPNAFNAVTLGMITALESFYHRCAKNPHIYGIVMEAEGKAFSSGGDIRALRQWGEQMPEGADRYYALEYQHDWTLQCFRKPHVALINGITMGGGVGISLYGTHRLAGENMRFAMPETGIGFFPDIGASWFLPRMPGMIGLYLGLTGHICDRADAYYVGFATHCIASEHFETVKAAMIEGEPIDELVDSLHTQPGNAALEEFREPIDRIFSAPTLNDIFGGLEGETGRWGDWSVKTLAILSKRSPLSLKVTFEQLRRGRQFNSLKQALVMEYRLATRMVRQPDFREGVRAILIDRDFAPKWQPATLSDVSDAYVQSFFEPLAEGDLKLVDYWALPLSS